MNRIRVVIEAVASGARKSVQEFRKDITEADGAVGKFKAGWKGAGELVRQNAALIQGAAVAAGAAVVAFGAKAAGEFQRVAIEADRFANSTGMSVQSASRWLAVMDRWGVELGDLQDVFNNVSSLVAESDPVFEQLGITIARAADGTTDMDATMKNLVRSVAAIEDPAKRAAAASKFFGEEGARQFSELIAQGKDVEAVFAAISDAKVIDDDEVRRARQYRAALERLDKAADDLTLQIGGALVPALSTAADGLADVAEVAERLKLLDMASEFWGWTTPLGLYGKAQGILFDDLTHLVGKEEELRAELEKRGFTEQQITEIIAKHVVVEEDAAAATKDHADAAAKVDTAVSNAAAAMAAAGRQADDLAAGHRDAADAAQEQVDAIDDLAGRMTDLVGGEIAVEDAQARAKKAVEEYETAARDGNKTEEELAELRRRAQEATLDAARAVGDYEADQRRANGETLTAADVAGIYADALGDLATVLDPSGQLRQNLAGYKQQLDDAAAKQAEITTAQAAVDTARTREQQAAATGVVASQIGAPLSAGPVRGEPQTVQAPYVTNNYHETTYLLSAAASAKEVDNARRDWEMRNGPGRR